MQFVLLPDKRMLAAVTSSSCWLSAHQSSSPLFLNVCKGLSADWTVAFALPSALPCPLLCACPALALHFLCAFLPCYGLCPLPCPSAVDQVSDIGDFALSCTAIKHSTTLEPSEGQALTSRLFALLSMRLRQL